MNIHHKAKLLRLIDKISELVEDIEKVKMIEDKKSDNELTTQKLGQAIALIESSVDFLEMAMD